MASLTRQHQTFTNRSFPLAGFSATNQQINVDNTDVKGTCLVISLTRQQHNSSFLLVCY